MGPAFLKEAGPIVRIRIPRQPAKAVTPSGVPQPVGPS
jgi:hypothetical protein